MEIAFRHTNRGFAIGEFKDFYGFECSIQESSMVADETSGAAIWFGRDTNDSDSERPRPRMHLTQSQVAALLPALQHFAATGDLPMPISDDDLEAAILDELADAQRDEDENFDVGGPGITDVCKLAPAENVELPNYMAFGDYVVRKEVMEDLLCSTRDILADVESLLSDSNVSERGHDIFEERINRLKRAMAPFEGCGVS